MLSLKIQSKELKDRLQDAAKQIPYATARAINDVAFKVRDGMKGEIAAAFDRPTSWTLNSVLVDKADKTGLRAAVYIRQDTPNGTAPADYLGAQVEGGGRNLKPYERGLNVGTIWQRFKRRAFGAGLKWLPASGATTDAHGNITKGYARRLLNEAGRPGSKFIPFVPDDGGAPLILQQIRKATRKRPAEYKVALIGVPRVSYKRRLRFQQVSESILRATYEKALEKRLDEALKTAR
jgi:hypothetical protein